MISTVAAGAAEVVGEAVVPPLPGAGPSHAESAMARDERRARVGVRTAPLGHALPTFVNHGIATRRFASDPAGGRGYLRYAAPRAYLRYGAQRGSAPASAALAIARSGGGSWYSGAMLRRASTGLHALLPLLVAGGALAFSGVSCGDGGSETSGTTVATGGGGSASSGGQTAGGGSGGTGDVVPVCDGVEIPPYPLDTSADGKTVTFACGGQTLSLTFLSSGILRIAYDLPGSARPSYATIPVKEGPPPIFGGSAETALGCTDDLFLDVRQADCHLRVSDRDSHVLLETPEGKEGVAIDGQAKTVRWSSAAGERYYGFGDKTGPLDKRSRTLSFYNTDAYDDAFGGFPPDADPLYASVPFFVGLRGAAAYGYFFDDTHRLTFDMASSDEAEWSVRAEGGAVDQYVFAGPRMADVVGRYTELTGRTPLPPRWSLGFHQSKWGYAPDTKVLSVAGELRSRKIPADAMWLDIQHMDGFRSFTWDPVNFPDPEGLVTQLEGQGFRAVSIVDPGVKVDPAWDVYATGVQSGYFLKGPDGQPYVGEVWPGPSVFPDFSAPEARAFWASLVPRTLDRGVRGLWIDMNEPSNFTGMKGGTVPDDLAAAGDGFPTTMAEMHNVYALNEARAVYQGMRDARPGERPFVLTRAGYSGIQRYAAMWTGDAPSSFATLRGTLPMLLGMGLSGLTFSGSDVGGYSGNASPELYARWMALGSISPFFRAHVTQGVNDQEPWQFGVEVTDISRSVIEERYRRMPYLYSLFRAAAESGAPVLRPLVYEFQDDPESATIDDEAMLGPSLLVAPVLEEGAVERDVYLPPGRWFEASSGAIVEGPAHVTAGVVLAAVPTFVREGAVVPRRDLVQWTDEKPIQTLELDVYPAESARVFELYEDDGLSFEYQSSQRAVTPYSAKRTAAGATVTAFPREGLFVPPPRDLVIRVRRVDTPPSAVTLDGQALSEIGSYEAFQSAAKGYHYDDRDLSILVRFPDPGAFELALDYDPTITDPAPDVLMDFEVTVPAGTPMDPPIHIASSANGWTHAPLAWVGPNKARGSLLVPRGEYVFYKYTRGGWPTVEKWPGCAEATNRYEQGKAHPLKEDTVWAWADQCP